MNLFISLLLIFIFYFDVWPLVKRKFKKSPKTMPYKYLEDCYSQILDSAVVMLKSTKVKMSFEEEHNLYSFLSKVKRMILGNKKHQDYRYFNFPRAWLMVGILDAIELKHSDQLLSELIKSCDKLIDRSGNLLFKFDKLDQALFGIIFIRLFKLTNDERYLRVSDEFYEKLAAFQLDGLLLYRKNLSVYFVDSIGMSVPFLYYYQSIRPSSEALKIARRQIDFYVEYGLEPSNKLPYHAIDLKNNVKLGSVNWTRGVGWFLLGLAHAIKFEIDGEKKKSYSTLFAEIVSNLESLASEKNYWSQFLGHTNDNSIDSSATLMIYHSMVLSNYSKFEFSAFSQCMQQSINLQGMVINSSGDTFYINRYSAVKSISEVSQGLLLSIISKELNIK